MENIPEGNYIRQGVIYINDPTCCFICKKTGLDAESKYCAACGFPQGGEQEEKILFYRNNITNQMLFEEAKKSVKNSQTALFVASGLSILTGLIMGALNPEDAAVNLVLYIILSAIFLGLGFLGKQQPLVATVSGLVIYISLILFGIFFIIYQGEEIKRSPVSIADIAIIFFLARGISGALKAERFRKEKGWDWRMDQ